MKTGRGSRGHAGQAASAGFAHCSLSVLLVVVLALALSSNQAFGRDNPPVWIYAKQCFDKVGLNNDEDLDGPFDCRDGVQLPVTVNGHIGDIGLCSGKHCLDDFPDDAKGCDAPAWLGGAEQCYGHSYLRLWVPKSNKDVRAALLCRHSERWSDNPRNFNDIAMIVHNVKNGETCWFQSRLGRIVRLNGTKVDGPAKVRTHLFWQRPKKAMQIGCIGCHDSGPFVMSPWISRAFKGTRFFDTKKGPYKNSVPPFDKWPQPRYVDIGKFGLSGSMKPCTACHKIAAGGSLDSDGDGNNDMLWQTCERWIDWATDGRENVLAINKTNLKKEPIYMPLAGFSHREGFLMPGREWNRAYKDHVDQLRNCCQRLGSDPRDTDRDCKFFVPKG
jgi:hypothetical protein